MKRTNPVAVLVPYCLVVLAWSAIHPYAYGDWFFEVILGVAGVAALAVTYRWFRFSNLVYWLVGIHFTILAVGGKYTYEHMPLFNWLRDHFLDPVLGLHRNYFDRVGHFAQGFVPAIIARELLLRTSGLERGKWLSFICVAICLAISAFYELIEWWIVLLFYPAQGEQWLGTQGDIWDAQGDMLMAMLGATLALLILSKAHDRSLGNLEERLPRNDRG